MRLVMIFRIPVDSTYFSPPVFSGVRVAHLSKFFVLSYFVSFRSEFRVVMSVTISA